MEKTGHHSAEAARSYKRTSSHQQQRFSGILNNEERQCNASKTAESTSVHVQANQNAQMHHLSLECNSTSSNSTSNNSTPVFNVSNCSTMFISFFK